MVAEIKYHGNTIAAAVTRYIKYSIDYLLMMPPSE
jgi:hypothetical protein